MSTVTSHLSVFIPRLFDHVISSALNHASSRYAYIHQSFAKNHLDRSSSSSCFWATEMKAQNDEAKFQVSESRYHYAVRKGIRRSTNSSLRNLLECTVKMTSKSHR